MSPVAPIRDGLAVPCANRPDDERTIRHRRLLGFAERDPEAEPATLALGQVLWQSLPCAGLRCLIGTLDEKRDFKLRLAELEIARHEAEAYRARIDRCRILHGGDAAEEMFPENDRLWERYRTAMLDMARTPARTAADLRRKRSAIGVVWFRAEGAWHDQLRAAVAADEAGL